MFPLVHYFVNSKIFGRVPRLTALGALWPDLAFAAGYSRDRAHEMGGVFYAWVMEHSPEGRDLALGIISHGIAPRCVDYYADESWPGYRKGWCFKQGEPYMRQIKQATRLPDDMIWWKSHNFVEMCCEIETDKAAPEIKRLLLEAIDDRAACETAGRLLSAYTGLSADAIANVFARVPMTFAIDNVVPGELAKKQSESFITRNNHHDSDVQAMTDLLKRMHYDLTPVYSPFIDVLIHETGTVLAGF